jgi:hypothetical protein
MATITEIGTQLGDFANATSVLMAESERMLAEFPTVATNKFMGYERPVIGDMVLTGDGTRQINSGYNLLQTTGDGFVTFPVALYGGAQADEAMLVEYKPEMQVKKREILARNAPKYFIDDVFHTGTEAKSAVNITSLKQFAVANGRTELMATNGAPLSLKRLAAALEEVPSNGADVKIYMSSLMKPLMSGLTSNQNVSGNVNILPNQFGVPFYSFMGIPIVFVGRRFDRAFRLGFNETTGTNNETTSVLITANGENDIFSIMGAPVLYKSDGVSIVTTPDGKKAPQVQEVLDIPLGIGFGSKYSIWRIGGITNAAIVA